MELKIPKLWQAPFETAIIERYRRRESSIEEALMEMYLAGVSVRRVEDITEALWGMRVSVGTVAGSVGLIVLSKLTPFSDSLHICPFFAQERGCALQKK